MFIWSSVGTKWTIKQVSPITKFSVPLGTDSWRTESKPSSALEHELLGLPSFFSPLDNGRDDTEELGTRSKDISTSAISIECIMERFVNDDLLFGACMGSAVYPTNSSIKYLHADYPPKFDIKIYQNITDVNGHRKDRLPEFLDRIERIITLHNVVFLKNEQKFVQKKLKESVAFAAEEMDIDKNVIFIPFKTYGPALDILKITEEYSFKEYGPALDLLQIVESSP